MKKFVSPRFRRLGLIAAAVILMPILCAPVLSLEAELPMRTAASLSVRGTAIETKGTKTFQRKGRVKKAKQQKPIRRIAAPDAKYPASVERVSRAPLAAPRKSITASQRSHHPAAATLIDANSTDIERCIEQIRSAWQPARVIRLAEECEKKLPAGQPLDEILHIAKNTKAVLEIQKSAGLSTDLFDDLSGNSGIRETLMKAVRGDKDAAYAIADGYRTGRSGIEANTRRMEQWLRFSAELGNGRASWELAEHYNYDGLVADAARFEKKAHDQGFQAGVRLPSRGY